MAGNIFHVEFGINETELTKALERCQYKKAADLITSCANPSYLDEGCYQRTPLFISLCGVSDDESQPTPRNFYIAQLLMRHGANVSYRVPVIDFSEYLAPGKSSLELLVDLYNSLTVHPCHADGNLIGADIDGDWDPTINKIVGLSNKQLLLKEDVLEHIADLIQLLSFGNASNLNIRDEFQMTPLHRAAIYSQDLDLLRLLCECGADVNAVDIRGNTPLAALCDAFPFGIKKFLEAKPFGDPYTEYNRVGDRHDFVKFLFSRQNLDVNARNKVGRTALFNCMVQGDHEVATLLLRHGADPCLKGQVLDKNKSREVSPLLAALCSFPVIKWDKASVRCQIPRLYQFLAHLVDRGFFSRQEVASELVDYLSEDLSHLRSQGVDLVHKMFGGTSATLKQLCARQIFQSAFLNGAQPCPDIFPSDSPVQDDPDFNLNDFKQTRDIHFYVTSCVDCDVVQRLVERLHLPRDTLLSLEIELFRCQLVTQFMQYKWFRYYDVESGELLDNSFHSDEFPSDEDDSDLEYW